MIFQKSGLVPGRILKRYQRFLADIELERGGVVTAHCTNTGAMKSCWEPGDLVLLEPQDRPERKLKFTWIACERAGVWVGVDTGIPNRVVAEAARQDKLPGLSGLQDIRTEVPYGQERSRVDVLARDGAGRHVYIEVKNTTLRIGDWACFPDAVTVRGAKHLRELQAMVQEGHRAVILFLIHRGDVTAFDAAWEIDPAYGAELRRAEEQGVVVLPLKVDMGAFQEGNLWRLEWELKGFLPWISRA